MVKLDFPKNERMSESFVDWESVDKDESEERVR